MLRKINNIKFLFLCQSADWQCVVEAEDEENAATLAIEKVMKECVNDEEYMLSMVIAVKKLSYNLIEDVDTNNCIAYYSPSILANAGFHNESANLHNFLQAKASKENE